MVQHWNFRAAVEMRLSLGLSWCGSFSNVAQSLVQWQGAVELRSSKYQHLFKSVDVRKSVTTFEIVNPLSIHVL